MKFYWYFNRLKSMEPAELLHRLFEQQRRTMSRGRDEGWARYPAPALCEVLPRIRETLLGATIAHRNVIKSAAENVLAGRFEALGRVWPRQDPKDLFPDQLWRLDPVTGKLWPGSEKYSFDIDFRDADQHRDIKYVWEINRLQMMLPLAADVVLNDNICSLQAIEAMIASWHTANPPFRGTAWNSGIEIAIRSINLIVTLALVAERLSSATRIRIGSILVASSYWIRRFPSKFSSANNHRVAELAGEFLVAMALGRELDVREELVEESQKQFFADGVGAEQTPTYAALCAESILLCAMAARQAGNPLPPAVDDRLAAFADFIAWLGPGSRGFGDNDEGRILTLAREADYMWSVAAAVNGYLGRPGTRPLLNDIRTLLFGSPTVGHDAPKGMRTFPHGGLTVWRGEFNGRTVNLTFDHGPLGYLSIAAHGHADALSITLDIDGEAVLIDPGTFVYGSNGNWREWFRSTRAHNTLNIKGKSQSVSAGPFIWSHKANATLVTAAPEPAWKLQAQHDGYRREFGVIHQRTIELTPNGIAVTDQLLGGAYLAEITLQLAAGLSAEQDRDAVIVRRGRRPMMAIVFPDEKVRIAAGGDVPGLGGWDSPRFGMKIPAERMNWHGEVDETGIQILLIPFSET